MCILYLRVGMQFHMFKGTLEALEDLFSMQLED
jgi:hypothetical protein